MTPAGAKLSVLLLDDNHELAELYKLQLEQAGDFDVATHTDGWRARQLAERQLFDAVVIDAKLYYRGHEFGGLRLADDLRARYGAHSLVIISRFITAELMHEHGASYAFIDKGAVTTQLGVELARRIRALRAQQYVFVAMPFAAAYRRLYGHLRRGVEQAGFRCVRVDEVAHSRPIQELVFELVEKSKCVTFVADGGNANAYYEAGFADAMRKELVIVARGPDALSFDVASRHTLFYGARPAGLAAALAAKLTALRMERPPEL